MKVDHRAIWVNLMDVSYWMLKFLRQPSAALARRYLGIEEATDGGGGTPGSGDVVGPASATAGNFASFGDGTGKLLADSGSSPANMPTANQKAALAGTNGAPAAGNPYVTDSDPRNTNSRAPTAHAANHEDGGIDEINVTGLMGLLGQQQDPTNHSSTHSNGGTDAVIVTNLAGFTGDPNDVLLGDATFGPPPSGSGDVVGPASSTDNAIARFNGTGGKTIQNSAPIVEDDGRISTVTDPTGAQDAATKAYVDANAGSDWDVTIVKSADQTVTNNATPQNDSELSTTLDADTFYLIELQLVYSGNDTNGDYRCRFTFPTAISGGVIGTYTGFNTTGTAVTTTAGQASLTQWPTGDVTIFTDTEANLRTCLIRIQLMTAGSGGTLQYQFGNVIAGVGRTSTTRARSTLRLKAFIP